MGVVRGEGADGGMWSWPDVGRGPRETRVSGFTVLELVIVLVIAAILVGVTVPVYVVAREQQRQLTCSGFLHQVYVALRQYQEDEGGFPPAYRPRVPVDPATSPLDPAYGCDYGAVATLLQPGFGHLSRSLYGPKEPGTAHPIGLRCPDDFTSDSEVGSYYSSYSQYYNYWGYDADGVPYTAPVELDATSPYPIPPWDPASNWPAGVPPSAKWDYFPKLGNEYYDWDIDPDTGNPKGWRVNAKHTPPASTIITRCPYHRRRVTGPELIVRLDGHYERIRYSDWLQNDGVGDPFVYQPATLGRR